MQVLTRITGGRLRGETYGGNCGHNAVPRDPRRDYYCWRVIDTQDGSNFKHSRGYFSTRAKARTNLRKELKALEFDFSNGWKMND